MIGWVLSKDTIHFYPDNIHFSSFVPERAKRRNPDSRTREWWQSTEWLTALLDWLLLETMAYITWGWQNNWHQTNNWRKRVRVWCPPCWCWSRIRKKSTAGKASTNYHLILLLPIYIIQDILVPLIHKLLLHQSSP